MLLLNVENYVIISICENQRIIWNSAFTAIIIFAILLPFESRSLVLLRLEALLA